MIDRLMPKNFLLPAVSILNALGARGAWLVVAIVGLAAPPRMAAAEPMTGRATLELQVTVDADALTQSLDDHSLRLDEIERQQVELRRLIETLGEPIPPGAGAGAGTDVGLGVVPVGGFFMFPFSPDSRLVFVAGDGNDANSGFTPDQPLRTPAAGYAKLRDGRPDHLLFRAGDTFTGNLGILRKSGRNADQPMVIGVYDNPNMPDAPRPILLSPEGHWALKNFGDPANHIAFVGLHLVAVHRDPDGPDFNDQSLTPKQWKHAGITMLGDTQNITVQDCRFQYFNFALVFQSNKKSGYAQNIRLHRNIVLDSYGHWDKDIAGHSSGIYAAYIDGLSITQSVFDHNGWNERVRGAGRTKFNHNLYLQYDCTGDTRLTGNIITRGSAHGLQLRAGGVLQDNLFVENPLAFFVGRNKSVVRRNVILHSIDMGPDQDDARGHGFEVLPCVDALIEQNILAQKGGSLEAAAAITVAWEKSYIEWLDGRPSRVTIRDNKIYKWPRYDGREQTIHLSTKPDEFVEQGNVIDGDFPDPKRDVGRYMESIGREASLEAFLDVVRDRPRGQWNPAFAAEAVNAYVREGFE